MSLFLLGERERERERERDGRGRETETERQREILPQDGSNVTNVYNVLHCKLVCSVCFKFIYMYMYIYIW